MDEFPQDDVIDLRTYAMILWRRRLTVILVLVAVVATAVGLTFAQTPLYQSEAELAIEPLRRSEDASLTDLILGSATIETERRVITSGPVTEAVIENLALAMSTKDLLGVVTVTTVRDTRVVTIRATDPDPELAAAIANEFTTAYLTLRRQEALDRLLAARQSLDERARLLNEDLAAVNAELSRPIVSEQDRLTLEAQRDSILTQLGQVSAQQLSADAESDLVRGGGTVLRVAEVPTAPSSPKKIRTGILAMILGAMLGVGVAFAKDFLDDGVRAEEVLQRATGGAPVFGRVPTWNDPTDRVLALVAPRDHAVEAYRELRANVRFVIGQQSRQTEWEGRRRARREVAKPVGRSVLITSSAAGEGKSSTASNLAVVAAQGGAKVALVDADMRKPRQAKMFGLSGGTGLSHHLAEGGDLADRLIRTGMPGLVVLPAGPTPPNPAELLASRAMSDVLAELEESHDLVVVDSPPILAVADALELAQMCSATLLVASSKSSSQRAIKRAIERLGHIGVLISGAVLNDIDRAAMGSYYNYYRPYEHEGDDADSASGDSRWTSRRRSSVTDPVSTTTPPPNGSARPRPAAGTPGASPAPRTPERAPERAEPAPLGSPGSGLPPVQRRAQPPLPPQGPQGQSAAPESTIEVEGRLGTQNAPDRPSSLWSDDGAG